MPDPLADLLAALTVERYSGGGWARARPAPTPESVAYDDSDTTCARRRREALEDQQRHERRTA